MRLISTQSTSKNTEIVSNLVLRETQKTRLIFRPLIIDNERNQEACIKGWFIFQVKNLKEKWEDLKTFDLSKLKSGEWVKLELKAEEVLKLLKNCEFYKEIYKKHGITYGPAIFPVTDENIATVLEKVSNFANKDLLIKALQNLSKEKLADIDSLVSVAHLENISKKWDENVSNNNEEFWQQLFQNNAWILSQIFSCPFILIGKKFYCGGKEDDDKGGIKGDLLYKNDLTGNLAFIEIKTPKTDIMGSEYRGEKGKENVVYSMSNEISGGINQVLNQRKTYLNKHGDNNGKFLNNAKCILVIGKISDFKNDEENKSFELFRSSIKEVEIITFDELFGRIKAFLKLLKDSK